MSKEEKLKVVLVEPGKKAVVKEIDGSLEGMQKVVGGYIEAIYPFDDPVALVCNEEGKLEGLAMNRALRHEGAIYDVICGTFFLCLAPADSSEFESLTDDLVEKYLELYKNPEYFFKIGNQVIVVEE